MVEGPSYGPFLCPIHYLLATSPVHTPNASLPITLTAAWEVLGKIQYLDALIHYFLWFLSGSFGQNTLIENLDRAYRPTLRIGHQSTCVPSRTSCTGPPDAVDEELPEGGEGLGTYTMYQAGVSNPHAPAISKGHSRSTDPMVLWKTRACTNEHRGISPSRIRQAHEWGLKWGKLRTAAKEQRNSKQNCGHRVLKETVLL